MSFLSIMLRRMLPGNSCGIMPWRKTPRFWKYLYIFIVILWFDYMYVFNLPGNCYTVWGEDLIFFSCGSRHLPECSSNSVNPLIEYYQYFPYPSNCTFKIISRFPFLAFKAFHGSAYFISYPISWTLISFWFSNCIQMRPRGVCKALWESSWHGIREPNS